MNLLLSQHEAFQEALRQGRQGLLEPNRVFRPHSHLYQGVPDLRVRNYFLTPDAEHAWALHHVLYLLRSADVEVYRLDRPLRVPDFIPYGGTERRATIPAGAYWIPAAQAQKHWVQAMLNADTYVPVRADLRHHRVEPAVARRHRRRLVGQGGHARRHGRRRGAGPGVVARCAGGDRRRDLRVDEGRVLVRGRAPAVVADG